LYKYIRIGGFDKIEIRRLGAALWRGLLERAFAVGPGRTKEADKKKEKKDKERTEEPPKPEPRKGRSAGRPIKQNDKCIISQVLGRGLRFLF
jgi:hypothetical protein